MSDVTINSLIGRNRKCPVCGKTFIPNIDWAYKRGLNRVVYLCSWHCLREWDSRHMKTASRREMVLKLYDEGLPVKEIADRLGVDNRTVNSDLKRARRDGII